MLKRIKGDIKRLLVYGTYIIFFLSYQVKMRGKVTQKQALLVEMGYGRNLLKVNFVASE